MAANGCEFEPMTRKIGWGLMAAMLLASALPALAENRALLVGVSVYANLPDKNLVGAANDVALMAKTVAGLGFAPAQTTLLSEAAGALPTRANILAGLAGLARQSQPGDWVLVYLSGHGAQVPRASQSGGMDEVFLPRDTEVWNPASHQVQGAVRDQELAVALGAIRAKGAHVWAILDTCHAADMLRKPGPPQAWRFITPQALQLPMQLWSAPWSVNRPGHATGPATRRAAQPGASANGVAAGRYVAFFSSQKGEGSAEELLPDPEAPDKSKRFGLFTYKLALAVPDWRGSFKDLADRIEAGYQDRPFPTPEFVGALALRPPFGLRDGLAGP
jgi:hypothetical protein